MARVQGTGEREEVKMSETRAHLVSPAELAARIETGDTDRLRLVDASWYLPAMNRDGSAEYEARRLPGAVYFDIDAIADTTSNLPHMLPDPEEFATAAGALGIRETDDIVIYDGPGIFSSARVWWTFRVMGAANVRILEGGIDGWVANGLPVETGPSTAPAPARFNCSFDPARVRDYSAMRANVRKGGEIVLDARPFGRFTGEDAEPRPGLRSGHIPGSRSLPAMNLVREGTMLPDGELAAALEACGVMGERAVVTTCGSGVTAAILSLALELTGHRNHALYDGSWADWGSRPDAPVAMWAAD